MNVLLDLANPWGYVLIFLLAAAEGAALIGLFLPGETAMLIGGVLVHQGRANAGLMLIVGCLGAVLGDSVGYWVGRRFGERLESSRLGRRVGEERWQRAGTYLRERGGKAVFFGRFLGFLRTLIPPMAGSTAMPYRRFVAFNAPAATLWAAGFISLGIAAGGSWQLVDRWAGRASLVLLVIVTFVLGVFLFAHWLSNRRDYFADRWRAFLDAPIVRRLRERFRAQLEFIARRLDPAQRFGLYFSVGIVVAFSAAFALGGLIDSLREGGDAAEIDRAVLEFFNTHRTDTLTDVMRLISRTASTARIVSATALVGAVASISIRRLRWVLFTVLAILGTTLLDDLVGLGLRAMPFGGEPVSEVADGSFPSDQATASAGLVGTLVYTIASRHRWRAAVWVGAAAVVAAFLMGLSYVYLGRQLPSAVLAGFFLGGFWIAVAATSTSQIEHWPTGRS